MYILSGLDKKFKKNPKKFKITLSSFASWIFCSCCCYYVVYPWTYKYVYFWNWIQSQVKYMFFYFSLLYAYICCSILCSWVHVTNLFFTCFFLLLLLFSFHFCWLTCTAGYWMKATIFCWALLFQHEMCIISATCVARKRYLNVVCILMHIKYEASEWKLKLVYIVVVVIGGGGGGDGVAVIITVVVVVLVVIQSNRERHIFNVVLSDTI